MSNLYIGDLVMQKYFLFKILVGGDGGVGKTTLLRRYVNGKFDDSTIMTVGVDFFVKEISLNFNNSKMKCSLQLWDLGGQKQFRHLMSSYVMGARGALLLIDLTRLPEIKAVLEWVNIIRMHDIDIPIILAREVPAVPREYLGIDSYGGYFVRFGKDRKEADERPITIGAVGDLMVEVVSGASEGDSLLPLY